MAHAPNAPAAPAGAGHNALAAPAAPADDDEERRKKIKYMLIGFIAGCIGGYVFYLYIADSKVNQLRISSNNVQNALQNEITELKQSSKSKNIELNQIHKQHDQLKDETTRLKNTLTEQLNKAEWKIKKLQQDLREVEWKLEKEQEKRRRSCFSSESYVLIFPEYKKKKVDELIGNEKILIYNRINHIFVWDNFIYKSHCDKVDVLHDKLIEMIEITLENNSNLIMTENHLIFVNDDGLKRMDQVKIGDIVKHYIYGQLQVVEIKKTYQYPRNIWTYNGNVVVNGIVISCFNDSTFSQLARSMLDIYNSLNLWKYPISMFVKTAQYLKICIQNYE